jgi:ATP synthase protein I
MSNSQAEVVLDSELQSDSMAEYYQLKRNLLTLTLLLSIGIFLCVWGFYGLDIALNYGLGAFVGVVFLGLLARNVERLGGQGSSLGKSHIALFIGLIIVATRLPQLQVLPIFLGFLTYKVTLLIYVLRAVFQNRFW